MKLVKSDKNVSQASEQEAWERALKSSKENDPSHTSRRSSADGFKTELQYEPKISLRNENDSLQIRLQAAGTQLNEIGSFIGDKENLVEQTNGGMIKFDNTFSVDWKHIDSYRLISGVALLWSLEGSNNFANFILDSYSSREKSVELVQKYAKVE